MPQTELGHKHLRHPREGLQACDRASTRPCPSTSGSTAARLPSPSVPTHSSAPRLPAAPTRVIPIHYSSITPTASSSCCCNGGDLVRVTAKGRNPLILTRRCHASFSTLPRDGEDKHLPAEKARRLPVTGEREMETSSSGSPSHGRATLLLSAAVPAPVPSLAGRGAAPLRCPLPSRREVSGERGAPTQRSSEQQTLPSALHPFLHLPSPPALQNRPRPFIKGGKKTPRITHPKATPCFSLQGD